jgi:uncharacterized protein with ATP-grasp and redox domains
MHPPPFVSTGEPYSFARKTIQYRKPAIIERLMDFNLLSEKSIGALTRLKNEMREGYIFNPFEEPGYATGGLDGESRRYWCEDLPHYVGKSWLDVPFYFAEAYLYWRILIAVGYFDPGSAFFMRDPFQSFKNRELFAKGGGLEVARVVAGTMEEMRGLNETAEMLIASSLWGNRIDLSLFSIAEKSRERVLTTQEENLIVNEMAGLKQMLEKSARVSIVLDNSGHELVCDLLLCWFLLTKVQVARIDLHAKKYPIYVSDSMVKDVDHTLAAFISDSHPVLSRIGRDLFAYALSGKLRVIDHPFWNSSLHFPELPEKLMSTLRESDLVLFKGDVNYRRLLSDRKWSFETRIEDIVSYMPVSLGLLRTMKSEIVVDIDEKQYQALTSSDPEWMVNGERGIIRVVEVS